MKKDNKATLRAGGAEIMKRILALAGCLLFLAAGKAEPVSFGAVTVDSACLRLDLGPLLFPFLLPGIILRLPDCHPSR